MADTPGSIRPIDIILRALGIEEIQQQVDEGMKGMSGSVHSEAERMQADLKKTEDQIKQTAETAKQKGREVAQAAPASSQPAIAAAPRSTPLTSTSVVTPASPSPYRPQQQGNYQPLTDSQLLVPRPPGDPNGPIRFNPDHDAGFQKKPGGLVWDEAEKKWKDTSPARPQPAPPAPVAPDDDPEPERKRWSSGRIRLVGAGLTWLGTRGIAATNRRLAETQDARSTNLRMANMLTRQGDGGSVDAMQALSGDLAQRSAMADTSGIKDAITSLSGFGLEAQKISDLMPGLIGYSRTYGKELDAVAKASGDALNSGSLSALENLGVTITEAQRQAVKEAETQAERQAAVYEILKNSFSSYSDALTAGMTLTEINANRAALAMNELQVNMATGAERVDAFAKGVGVSLLEMVMPSQGIQETAGAVQALGSYALTAGGSVMTLLGNVSEAKAGLEALGITASSVGPAVNIGRAALAPLVPFFSAALPVAVAAGIALIFKAVADAKFEREEEYNNATQPNANLPSSSTQSGALAQAKEMDRLAEETQKGIDVRKDERGRSWPINIFTGKTPAQYDEEIERMEEERQGYVKRAAELRERASKMSAPASAAPAIPMPAVATTPVIRMPVTSPVPTPSVATTGGPSGVDVMGITALLGQGSPFNSVGRMPRGNQRQGRQRSSYQAELTNDNFIQAQRPDGGIDLLLRGRISLVQDTFIDALSAID